MKLRALIFLVIAALPAGAAILHVPGDYAEIETALAAAAYGDTVWVAPGVYHEWTVPLRSGVALLAEDTEPDATVIDADAHTYAIVAEYVDASALMRGFTILGALSSGIFLDTSDPRIEDCRIVGNSAPHEGGGALLWHSSARFARCRFSGNEAERGGGVFIRDLESEPSFLDCEFFWNEALESGGGVYVDGSRPSLSGCVFLGNRSYGDGGGLWADHCLGGWPLLDDCVLAENRASFRGGGAAFYIASGLLRGCTIVGNAAEVEGGGLWLRRSTSMVENTIVAFNEAGGGLACGPFAAPWVQCCDFYGNDGGDEGGDELCGVDAGGNFTARPLFCDRDADDFTLAADSPCLPLGNECGVLVGARGLGCEEPVGLPEDAPLADAGLAAFPNPFNPSTEIRFALAEAGPVALAIFDLAGRRVRTLYPGTALAVGEHILRWDGRGDSGRALASGVYFLRLDAGGRTLKKKLTLLK